MELRYKCLQVVILVVIGGVWVKAAAADTWIDQLTSVTSRAIQECENTKMVDLSECLKSKALRVMDRALKSGPLSIGDGLTLIRKAPPRDARALPSIEESESASPEAMDDLLAGRAERFLETRSLQMPLTTLLGIDQSVGVTGRGKMKKMAGPAILMIVMAAYKLAMLMAGIAMLSGKALIVSKVALTLAGVAVLKKLLSNGEGHEKTTVEIVKTPQVSHSHTYSSHHDEYGHHDKSWTVTSPYNHRSSIHGGVHGGVPRDPMDYPTGPAESSEAMAPVYSNRRSFRTPATVPGPSSIDSVRISGRTPLRVVLASPALLEDEPPMSEEYSQFGVPDTGAWRGLGSNGNASAGSEYTERAGMMQHTNTEYHPRSL